MAAEGAVGAAVAAGAFSYNRGNFMYDAEFRFERFSAAREYANQQSEQYRGDIRNLAALTVKKNTLWTVTSTLCMALNVALYCAGRLGLHGPSPPAWIMGLWLTNNAASFAFMAVCIFLAIHASFRAQAASTQLLTRKTRVPVPTLRQLDGARKFASEFEQQEWGDIFRIPYLSNNGAPKTDDAVYDEGGERHGPSPRGARSRSAPPGPRGTKCSSWVREEFETDRQGTGAAVPPDEAPEHFKLWTAAQKEFYQHDIYARVCIFYGFIHYVQSLAYYGLGHINIELRAFWVAYGCAFVIAVLMALLLRFDIIPANPDKKQYLPRCEFLGPLAILPAAIGMSLDFQVEYDPTAIALCWVMIFVAYILQLIYALRMLEVMLPDETFAGMEERLGASYLPEGWRKVPSSFYHVLYFVAPPGKLQPGQHDIVREVKAGETGAFAEATGKPAKDAGAACDDAVPAFADDKHVEPWKIVASIAGVLPVCWVWLIFGNIIDVALGEQALVTAPHWSRPPMTRISKEPHELGTPLGFPWPAADKPWLPEQMAWHEEKRHAGEYSFTRRLSAAQPPHDGGAGLSAALQGLLESIPAADEASVVKAVAERVSWPSFFEPQLLACGPGNAVAALTSRGFGAAATLGGGQETAAESFKLSGITHPLLGASWGPHAGDDNSLLLVSRAGGLLSCPGPRPSAGGAWKCVAPAGLPETLPISDGMRLTAASTALLPGIGGVGGSPRLHAALVHEGEPELVALFAHDAGSWLPLGEVRVPQGGSVPSLAFVGAGDLLVTTGHGHVLRRRLSDGAVVSSFTHAAHHDGARWQGTCGFHHGESQFAHLRVHQGRPEISTFEMPRAADRPPVFE